MTTPSRGIIVALIPNQDYTSRRPAIDNPHLTVIHLGSTEADDFSRKTLEEYWKLLQKVWGHQLRAEVTAESAFDGGEDGWAMVDLINAPFLPEFYTVAAESASMFGLNVNKDYGLLPHITRRYVKGQTTVEIVHRHIFIPFAFQALALWIGDDHLEVPLT